MGIRYFAHPVSPRQIAQSRQCPRGCFDGADAWEHWEPGEEPRLNLDKCYPELQWILGEAETNPARPSYALVEGEVTHTPWGWVAHRRVLDNAEAQLIAADLNDILGNAELTDVGCRFGDREPHAIENLIKARDFTHRVADAGFGIAYAIG